MTTVVGGADKELTSTPTTTVPSDYGLFPENSGSESRSANFIDPVTTVVGGQTELSAKPLNVMEPESVTTVPTDYHANISNLQSSLLTKSGYRSKWVTEEGQIVSNKQVRPFRLAQEVLTRAMEKGEISADEDPELLTDYLLSSYIGWHESFILNRDASKIQKMARFLLKQLSR